MKVMFQGAHSSDNSVMKACSVAAIMSSARYNRKTLVLQLTGSDNIDVEKYMIGKDMDEELQLNEANEVYRINDKGIDALIRRATTAKLTKDHFDSSCIPLLEYENMLDIASMSQKKDFVDNITVKDIRIILKYADDVYDNIFLILDGKNQLVMQEILELCDVYVTCLAQTPRKETFNTFESKRMLHLVTDYDNASAYSALYLKRMYKAKKIYLLRQNTEFKDSCLEGTLLKFMLKNVNNANGDDNYAFMKSITELMDGIMDKENWYEEIPEAENLDASDMPKEEEPEPLKEVKPEQVMQTSITVKKGIFQRKKKKNIVEIVEADKLVPSGVSSLKEDIEEEGLFEEFSENNALNKKSNENEIKLKPVTEHKTEISRMQLEEQKQNIDMTLPSKEKHREIMTKMQTAALKAAPIKEKQQSFNTWTCPKCGEVNEKQFCAACGMKKPAMGSWTCPECGIINVGRFCEECGAGRP